MSLNFKRNYPILIAVLLVIAVLVTILGGQRVIAYTTSEVDPAAGEGSGMDIGNTVDLFDDTVVHTVEVIMDGDDYDTMIATYQETGEKDTFHADVIIDGVRVNDVGIRLKGNASLQTALGGGMGGGMAGGQAPGGFDPQVMPQGFDPQNLPEGFVLPEGFDPQNMPQGGGPGNRPGAGDLPGGFDPDAVPEGNLPGGMFNQGASGQTGETKIPFLIKFDEYVSGQTYQGHTRLSLRTYGITYDEAMLEEPLTNHAFSLVGLPAAQTAYAGLAINGEAETLYVLSEVLDDPAYLERNFTHANGVLYKAEVGSSLSYVGDSPSSYANSFSQETRQNDADLAPLIEFARFLTESDDATFEQDLPSWLDVDSFATYLALTNLLVNTDSIVGMNNNYYLYYDDQAGRFSLLYWDGNESLGGLGMGTSATFDLHFQDELSMRSPGGGENILLQRFKANSTFMALYEQKLQQVYQVVFQGGAMLSKMEEYSALVHAVNEARSLVTIETYEQAVTQVQAFLQERMDYVDSTGLMDE